MKPSKSKKDAYESFTTPEDLADLLLVSWSAMKAISDDCQVEIMLDLPPIIPVRIKIKNKRGGRVTVIKHE